MLKKGTKKGYFEQLQELIEEYRGIYGNRFGTDDIADWAFENEKHDVIRASAKKELKRNLAKAAARKKVKDPQGRSVRAFHSAKYPRTDENGNRVIDSVWDHLYSMSFEHAALSFVVGRRAQLAGGCRSLKADSDSFNDNNPNAIENKIQMSFDFTFDVEDIGVPVVEEVDPKRPR